MVYAIRFFFFFKNSELGPFSVKQWFKKEKDKRQNYSYIRFRACCACAVWMAQGKKASLRITYLYASEGREDCIKRWYFWTFAPSLTDSLPSQCFSHKLKATRLREDMPSHGPCVWAGARMKVEVISFSMAALISCGCPNIITTNLMASNSRNWLAQISGHPESETCCTKPKGRCQEGGTPQGGA